MTGAYGKQSGGPPSNYPGTPKESGTDKDVVAG